MEEEKEQQQQQDKQQKQQQNDGEMSRRPSIKSTTGSERRSPMANTSSSETARNDGNYGNDDDDNDDADHGQEGGVNGNADKPTSVDVDLYDKIVNEKEKLEAMYANQMMQLTEFRFVNLFSTLTGIFF